VAQLKAMPGRTNALDAAGLREDGDGIHWRRILARASPDAAILWRAFNRGFPPQAPSLMSDSPARFDSFASFYPFYLGEHANLVNRRMHFVGSTLTLLCVARLIWTGQPMYLLYALLCGYGFAWVGHFFIEKNRPATFKYPLYSFMGDWVMYWDILLRRIACW
jgi:hypothetical protein